MATTYWAITLECPTAAALAHPAVRQCLHTMATTFEDPAGFAAECLSTLDAPIQTLLWRDTDFEPTAIYALLEHAQIPYDVTRIYLDPHEPEDRSWYRPGHSPEHGRSNAGSLKRPPLLSTLP